MGGGTGVTEREVPIPGDEDAGVEGDGASRLWGEAESMPPHQLIVRGSQDDEG